MNHLLPAHPGHSATERLCPRGLAREAAAPASGTPRGAGNGRADRLLRPVSDGRRPTPHPHPTHPESGLLPLGPDSPPGPRSPSRPCHPNSQPTLRVPGSGARARPGRGPGPGRAGRVPARRGGEDPGREGAAPLLPGPPRRRETTRPRRLAEAGGGGGRSRAAEGRYLIAVAVVVLHGGADSPEGRSGGRVELQGSTGASKVAPPPFM